MSFTLLASCVNTAEKSADDMADFADDPEFKEAHDDPRAAAAAFSGEMIDIPVEGGDAGKSIEIRQFEADHAFANPSNPACNESAAQEANALALAFLKENM